MCRIEIISSESERTIIVNSDTFSDCTNYQRIIYIKELLKDYLCDKLCGTSADDDKPELAKIVDSVPVGILYNITTTGSKYILCKFIYNKIIYHPKKYAKFAFIRNKIFKFDQLYNLIHIFTQNIEAGIYKI